MCTEFRAGMDLGTALTRCYDEDYTQGVLTAMVETDRVSQFEIDMEPDELTDGYRVGQDLARRLSERKIAGVVFAIGVPYFHEIVPHISSLVDSMTHRGYVETEPETVVAVQVSLDTKQMRMVLTDALRLWMSPSVQMESLPERLVEHLQAKPLTVGDLRTMVREDRSARRTIGA